MSCRRRKDYLVSYFDNLLLPSAKFKEWQRLAGSGRHLEVARRRGGLSGQQHDPLRQGGSHLHGGLAPDTVLWHKNHWCSPAFRWPAGGRGQQRHADNVSLPGRFGRPLPILDIFSASCSSGFKLFNLLSCNTSSMQCKFRSPWRYWFTWNSAPKRKQLMYYCTAEMLSHESTLLLTSTWLSWTKFANLLLCREIMSQTCISLPLPMPGKGWQISSSPTYSSGTPLLTWRSASTTLG